MTTAILLVLLGALSRLLPHPPNFVAMGAIGLYAGARLPRRWAWAVPLAAMALSDLFLDAGTGRAAITPIRLAVYGCFALMVAAGTLLAREAGPGRLALLAGAGAVLFFLVTNFVVWASLGTYAPTPAGLLSCYLLAIPWFWGTLSAELLGTAALFSLDALSRRQLARRAAAAAAVSALLLALAPHALAQAQVAPVAENIVVSATASPEEIDEVASSVTVVTREQIEQNGWKTVGDVLRSVPGVDVVTSGGPGSATSVFLRGANSQHTLVLIDGVRANSPFFPGYDFSLLSTRNVERVEVVRGPFSALYGSESIGGVVQVFTRPAGESFSATLAAEAGNADQRDLSAFATAGSKSVGVAASFRDRQEDGERKNDDWEDRSGSLRLEGRFANDFRVALEGSMVEGELGLPGPVGAESPDSRYTNRQETVILPASFTPADGHRAQVTLGWVRARPIFESPGFVSETDAQTLQARAADTFTAGSHRITGFVEWQRWSVDDESNFGVALDGQRAEIWSVGAEDSADLSAAWQLTAGLRYDRHSEFGDALSPRAAISYRMRDGWKLRASGGTGFRAPSVGELYYPFSGNPDLDPERSVSFDVGVEKQIPGGRAALAIFWSEFKDLIVFDFAIGVNFNVGRARSAGAELSWQQQVSPAVALDVGYTYLDTEDLDTGLPLIRRPEHSGFAGATFRPLERLVISPRAVYVGSREDVLATNSTVHVQQPPYGRVDFYTSYTFGVFTPFVRIRNLFDEEYSEANGYPAPS
ncbi:MAG TPA: TonB-dependent receptor, partial [Thermoanaerobaculia bacterium]